MRNSSVEALKCGGDIALLEQMYPDDCMPRAPERRHAYERRNRR